MYSSVIVCGTVLDVGAVCVPVTAFIASVIVFSNCWANNKSVICLFALYSGVPVNSKFGYTGFINNG